MTTLTESLGAVRKPWQWIAIGGGILLVWAALAIPELHRSRLAADSDGTRFAQFETATSVQTTTPPIAHQKEIVSLRAGTLSAASRLTSDRKIVRTSSMDMIVQHPAEVADQIATLAEGLGGYLVSSTSGGEKTAMLTVRVPASRFEEAQVGIRKLAVRVESAKVDAEDVTRQFVDQDATIRNLRAEEAGYLFILKQATTVKDMLAVSEKLSEVRGQIEEQQAEFNALSKQIETVAISISLRTEAEAQVFGLNWRPGYQLKLALRDGLESIATYATAMLTILLYLPAVLLWVGTILIGIMGSWRLASRVGRRWLSWKAVSATEQVKS